MCLGIPGRIIEIKDAQNNLVLAEFSGVRRIVNATCVRDEGREIEHLLGNWVLVHVGFAMSIIDEAQAAKTLKILTELGEAQAEIEAMRLSAAE